MSQPKPKQSGDQLVITPENQHPELKEPLARLRSEKRNPKPGSRYKAVHGNVKESEDTFKDAVVPVVTHKTPPAKTWN